MSQNKPYSLRSKLRGITSDSYRNNYRTEENNVFHIRNNKIIKSIYIKARRKNI